MKTRLTTSVIGALLIVSLLLGQSAQAGFVSIEVDVPPNGQPPAPGPPDFVWDRLPDGNARAVLTELFDRDTGDSFDVIISGITDADPILEITKAVTNNTGIGWIGFNIDLDPNEVATFVGTPSSDTMTFDADNSTAHSLVFGLPEMVADGASVSFTFEINIPTTGPFGFTLSQSAVPIPEPTTMALFGLAAALALVWRRRRTC